MSKSGSEFSPHVFDRVFTAEDMRSFSNLHFVLMQARRTAVSTENYSLQVVNQIHKQHNYIAKEGEKGRSTNPLKLVLNATALGAVPTHNIVHRQAEALRANPLLTNSVKLELVSMGGELRRQQLQGRDPEQTALTVHDEVANRCAQLTDPNGSEVIAFLSFCSGATAGYPELQAWEELESRLQTHVTAEQ